LKIIYCVDDVLAATKYIIKHNKGISLSEHQLYDLIFDYISKGEDVATYGFQLTFGRITDNVLTCNITVHPSFNKDHVHATLEV